MRWRLNLSSNQIVLAFSVFAMVVFNSHYWQYMAAHAPFGEGHNWLLWLTMPFFLLACLNFLIQLTFWPYVHKVWIPLLLVLGAGASYAVMTQNIYFNADMIQNIIQTNPGEAKSWLAPRFIGWVLLTGVLPALLYVWLVRVRYAKRWYQEIGWRLAGVAASVLVVALVAATAYGNYASFFRNNKGINHQVTPVNFIGASIKTAYNVYDANRPLVQIGLDAKRTSAQGERKKVFILVVGETTRAENWGLNGYTRQTTPQLAALGSEVINFPQVSSCGTATAISVPCLFSRMSRGDYNGNRAAHEEGLMDILQRAGIYTSWRENDGGCKGACDRIKHVNVQDWAPKNECVSEGCWDIHLLTGLQQEIDAMPGDGVIVLHTMGSHGPAYFERYPQAFKQFTPTCDTNQIQQCERQAVINTYDNTVLYIDHVLAQTIKLLQNDTQVDSALWYFSDHGESLGENGMYLHAAPYMVAPSQQTHIPMVFWASPGFYQNSGLNQTCLRDHAQQQTYSHDNIFHSMLGIMGVGTQEYQPDLDWFRTCQS